jgi:biotin synthase
MTKWTIEKITNLFEEPFFQVLEKARKVFKKNFPKENIEMCSLINIKTGGCPENCTFCNQSAHFKTNLEKTSLLDPEIIKEKVRNLKKMGVKRCCLGGAWRKLPEHDLPKIEKLIKIIKQGGLEACLTAGFLTPDQAHKLKESGLDYYNHNIESSREFYPKIVSTHTFEDRLQTLQNVEASGLKTCCGGIVGLGETRTDRIHFLFELSQLKPPPQSIPINRMIHFPNTPLESLDPLDKIEFIKTIAVTRILFPTSKVRLSGGRKELSQVEQAFCFYAGANSIFVGDTLLTAENQSFEDDQTLLSTLGLKAEKIVC